MRQRPGFRTSTRSTFKEGQERIRNNRVLSAKWRRPQQNLCRRHFAERTHWDGQKYPVFALREEVNASKKNVILLAPTLGLKSEPGNLVIRRNGLDEYLDKVLDA